MAMPPASIKKSLISGMRSPDPHVRDACGHLLVNFVDTEVANVMLDALSDQNSWVRTHAASFFAFNANPAQLSNSEAIIVGLRRAISQEKEDKRKALLEEALQRFL